VTLPSTAAPRRAAVLPLPAAGRECDVLVVGGGPAGSAAALTLRRHGLQITMLEASNYEHWRAGETLLPRVREPLSALAAQDVLAELSLPSYGNRSAWGATELVSQSFFGNVGAHGYHVDRRRFDAALAERCEAAGVVVKRSARVRSVRALQSGRYEVTDALAGRVSCSAIIDASGKAATIATRLGSRRERLDKLIALVAQFPIDEPHCYTLVEASADGWWYSAPVPGHRLVVAQLTDPDLQPEPKTGFMARLHATLHTRQRLSNALATPLALRSVAACSQRLRPPPSVDGPRRWLAVGDAALCADPLSGTGVQRALESGCAGALALLKSRTGDPDALVRYEAALDRQYAHYLQQRQDFYAAEARFPGHVFWQRRAISSPRC
jgi:flavin-dependent dehydrogenase